jgi:serpin B
MPTFLPRAIAPVKNRILHARTFAALLAGLLGLRSAAAPDPAARQAAQSTAAFGVDLYHLLAAREGNVLLSPYSVSEALALLSAGAAGKTQQEILQALHWAPPPGEMPSAFSAQDQELEEAAGDGAVLSAANGIWYQQGGELLKAFQDVARKQYQARVRPVDFIGDGGAVRSQINDWVGSKTEGKIPDLFPEGSISQATRLVLANAVYFKGRWEKPFEAGRTAPRPFFVARDQRVEAPTMATSAKLVLAKTDDCSILVLPYEGGGLSMAILLPEARDGLAALEQKLEPGMLARWLASVDGARRREVHVTLPRFKFAFSAELTAPLQQLGIVSAFSRGKADFSGIDGQRDLLVSTVLHKAWVEVNEEGTEAAAATGSVMMAKAIEMPVDFIADHPFLFLIRDTRAGTLLFLGRVADPTKS